MDIGTRKQLFLDDAFIQEKRDVAFVMHPPRKMGPVILPELPSEAGRVGLYGSVAEVDGAFMMWYWAFERRVDGKGRRGLALARSPDGVTWEKPILGVVERGGNKANNLVPAMGDTVSLNPSGPPEERFVLLSPEGWGDSQEGGLFLRFSADGIHYRLHPTRVFPFVPDTQNQVRYDRRLGKWVAYLRLWDPGRRVGRVEIDDLKAPWPFAGDHPPHRLWGKDHPPVPRKEIQTVLAVDEDDPDECDVYTPVVVEYPWADNAYVMFPSFYRHFPEPNRGGRFTNDGLLEAHLAVSRDGVGWSRPSRRPYIALGPEGAPDSKMMFVFAGLVRTGDEIHHYYCGYDVTHGQYAGTPELHHKGAICRAVQRLDGFVSLSAGVPGGDVTTVPLTFAGSHLELNIVAAATGECCVELLDEEGAVIPGYEYEACDPIYGDSTHHRVSWRGRDDVGALASQTIQLRILLANADVYAFQFVE
ncbi:MAG: hypothetical protein HN742_04335 [Lentisphaerae bacterium]|nr:hypothetical protein [Lentisphaerota bacterium]MBT4814233.1 hypothetical protein [Lentisphaerota bacterium]MBT5609156.1 hypothetical protein [Lentisphaerota bacterium]MBT7054164.1 hypothetical protein [Lentisphaerota bacterium]MBT7841072.1 hypothetical protein [Lentisphaerota bacterium]